MFPHSINSILNQASIDLFRYIIGAVGAVAILSVTHYVFKNKIADQTEITFAEKCGKYSLQIYVLQHWVLEFFGAKAISKLVKIMWANFFTDSIIVYDFMLTPAVAMGLAFLFVLLVSKMGKTKLSVILFGR